MFRTLFTASAALAVSCPIAMAQTPASTPAVPSTVPSCLAMLNDIGPKLAAAGLPASAAADVKAKGATMAGLCNQSKFKEAFDLHAQIVAGLAKK